MDIKIIVYNTLYIVYNSIVIVSIRKQGQPYNECQTDLSQLGDHESELFKAIVRANYTYRQANCYDLCYFRVLSRVCNCSFEGKLAISVYV